MHFLHYPPSTNTSTSFSHYHHLMSMAQCREIDLEGRQSYHHLFQCLALTGPISLLQQFGLFYELSRTLPYVIWCPGPTHHYARNIINLISFVLNYLFSFYLRRNSRQIPCSTLVIFLLHRRHSLCNSKVARFPQRPPGSLQILGR